jgi:MFS family permease
MMLSLQLFLPFAAGFFLSYVYRTANAVIAPLIGQELGFGDAALGLLTSTYFLAFSLAQLPVGILLDRYGPRRVESALLVVAALGALIYGLAHDLAMLAFGRAIIGLGVSACLMGPLKAFAIAYPKPQMASLTGWIMAAGGLGAIVAAAPLEYVVAMNNWRDVCLFGAALTLLMAGVIYFVVPDSPALGTPGAAGNTLWLQLKDIRQVFRAPEFWRFAPIAFLLTGGFQALQGLWAARWMSLQAGGDKMAVATQLSSMNLAVLTGMVFMGAFATRLVARGIKLESLYRGAMLVACLTLGIMVTQPQIGSVWLWPLLGLSFSLNSLAYTLLSQSFPASFAGRANSALNMVILIGAFALQWGLGVLIDLFRASGAELPTAYQLSFGLLVVGQGLAWAWFALARRPFSIDGHSVLARMASMLGLRSALTRM